MRIGIDVGGTKIEFVALDLEGAELHRHRVPTPRNDYPGTVRVLAEGVRQIEAKLARKATVGLGIPGTISGVTGLVKNANSTWLNGKPLDQDLAAALGRPVRCANDANCLAVSEATDGAGAGRHLVFAVILGTGCGGRPCARREEWSGRRVGTQSSAVADRSRVSRPALLLREEWLRGNVDFRDRPREGLRTDDGSCPSRRRNHRAKRGRRSGGDCRGEAAREPPCAQPRVRRQSS